MEFVARCTIHHLVTKADEKCRSGFKKIKNTIKIITQVSMNRGNMGYPLPLVIFVLPPT